MINIHLSSRSVFNWCTYKNTSACGYAYSEGTYLNGSDLAKRLSLHLSNGFSLSALSDKFNGFFAFIQNTDSGCVAAVDHIRSIPLFYARNGNDFYVSDDAEWIRSSLKLCHLDKKNTAEFLTAHMVTGGDTLFPEIKQMEAGKVLTFTEGDKSSDQLKRNKYFNFVRNNTKDLPVSDFLEQLDQVHLKVFNQLAESLNGKQAVIPLSGGFDSRLIAVMMHRIGYNNMKFITYGRPGNWESQISKEIADHLQIDWYFVPLTQNIWSESFEKERRKDFTFDSGKFSSHTIIQEYPVIYHLVENGIVKDDAVFIPGHSGGFISGKHIPASFLGRDTVSREELYELILKNNFRKWNWNSSRENYRAYFTQKIHKLLDAPEFCSPVQACTLYEKWIWQERQAKFIINSIRNFEHFGFEWRLPLWNRNLLDFWLTVPLQFGSKQKLLKTYFNMKHKLPVTPANSPKLAKVYDRYYPTAKAWIGRYIKDRSILQALNVKLDDVLGVQDLQYDFIPPGKRVLFSHINALGSIKYVKEILEKTNSTIKE